MMHRRCMQVARSPAACDRQVGAVAAIRHTAAFALSGLLLALHCTAVMAVPTFDAVRSAYRSSDVLVLDRDGALLQRVRTDFSVRRGQWVTLSDISPALRNAMLQSEDKRFFEHSGVDWQAVSAAAWANLWNTRTRGASTITMQLASLLDDSLARSRGGRSVAQKLQQAVSAQRLESGWRKDQILEAYLNLVPFRGELVGIDALSQSLFGKLPQGLDEREAALAAALVRAPNAKTAQVVERACSVLQAISGEADCQALDLFATAALQRRDFEPSSGIAPHLARQVVRQLKGVSAGSSVTTTLRASLQRFAVQTLQQQLRELADRNVEDGAVLVLDNASGEVLAWVGSSVQTSGAAEVDGVTALRQPGSALKPFLYGQAIAERRITAASLLEDSGAQISTPGGLYIPQNYDHHFKGWVSVRTALGASLNVPAVRTLVMVSPDAFQKQLQALGFSLGHGGEYYGYSLALGSAEVSLLQLTNAYRALASLGRVTEPSWKPGAKAGKPIDALDSRAAFIIGDVLSDANARARTFGSDSLLTTRFWTAVKTGTSKDMRDNWAVGYSQFYTVGVWVGNASGAPMWDVSGTTGAAPVWAAVMNFLHRNRPSQAPSPPRGLVQAPVRFAALTAGASTAEPLEAQRQEWFIQGTQQMAFALPSQRISGRARIIAPSGGTVIALDPDIPARNQRLSFTADGSGLHWLMDSREFARGSQAQWLPWPGKHIVQLADSRGRVLDEIRLEVRGAAVRVSAQGARSGGRPPSPY